MGNSYMPVKLGILSKKVDNSSLEKLIIYNNLCLLENKNISSNQIDHFVLNKLINFKSSLSVFQLLVSS